MYDSAYENTKQNGNFYIILCVFVCVCVFLSEVPFCARVSGVCSQTHAVQITLEWFNSTYIHNK